MSILPDDNLIRKASYKPVRELALPPAVIIEINGEDWGKGAVKKPYTPGEVLPYIPLGRRLKLAINVLLRGRFQ